MGNGYGKLGGNWYAHRASFFAFKGEIPPGAVIRHRCDNPHCVNPDHLEAGTVADNINDMMRRGRRVYHAGKGRDLAGLRDLAARIGIPAAATEMGIPRSSAYRYLVSLKENPDGKDDE